MYRSPYLIFKVDRNRNSLLGYLREDQWY